MAPRIQIGTKRRFRSQLFRLLESVAGSVANGVRDTASQHLQCGRDDQVTAQRLTDGDAKLAVSERTHTSGVLFSLSGLRRESVGWRDSRRTGAAGSS